MTSNDEDTTTGGGTISGGTFDGTVTNGDPDPDYNNAVLTGGTFNGSVTNHGTIAGGTFLSDVTNRGVIEGGIFENVISDQGGTVTSCAYPLRANLTGLSIAAVPSAMPKNTAAGFPAEPSAALTAAFEKDGADANLYQLSANEGYLLPDAIDVRCGAADGQTLALAAGTDYTYDPATGAIAIKKSVVTGPLLLRPGHRRDRDQEERRHRAVAPRGAGRGGSHAPGSPNAGHAGARSGTRDSSTEAGHRSRSRSPMRPSPCQARPTPSRHRRTPPHSPRRAMRPCRKLRWASRFSPAA